MATLTATGKYDYTAVPNYAVAMNLHLVYSALSYATHNATTATVSALASIDGVNKTVAATITGTNFGFNSGSYHLNNGTINSLTISINGTQQFKLDGIQLSALDAYYTYRLATGYKIYDGVTFTSGVQAVEARVLGGNDILNGSSAVDRIAGFAGNDKINGGGGNDRLEGWSGNDTITGGAGNDYLFGGAGSDVYNVDSVYDRVFETTTLTTTSTTDAGGTDQVVSSVTVNLSAYTGISFVEKLTLTGSTAINGTGNALANTIVGNNGANILRGNAGNDVLVGGLGADTLYGDAGVDMLRGGVGNDILWGGAGKDIFRFDTALSTATVTNVDQIKDFNPVDDTIQLSKSIFTKFSTATAITLGADFFKAIGSGTVQDSNDYIVYNKTSGELFYDTNGSAAGGSVKIALLGTNLSLTNADFTLVA